ncbi:MAG: hypothetical protein CW338_05335 [Clostridiales bacterium]|nr:hypothetical protein [Clostridiales bacterium]
MRMTRTSTPLWTMNRSVRPCLTASWPCWKKRMSDRFVSFPLMDGSEMVFRVAGIVDLEDEDYAILEQTGENGSLLVAKVIDDRGTPSFMPVQDEGVINAVMEKFAAQSIYSMMENASLEEDDDDDCDCGCGDHHHSHEDHGHHCDCGHCHE